MSTSDAITLTLFKRLPITTGTQEQRFTILKKSMLGTRINLRMDEFSQLLHELFLATEKDFVVDS